MSVKVFMSSSTRILVPEELEKAFLWAVNSARESDKPTFGIGIFPVWRYTAERKHIGKFLEESKGAHKMIVIPEKAFDILAQAFGTQSTLGGRTTRKQNGYSTYP
eukprot:5510327-Pyramimonas_sp.AAC.2